MPNPAPIPTDYAALAKAQKACRLCPELLNPADARHAHFDGDEIGPWSRWPSGRPAKLLRAAGSTCVPMLRTTISAVGAENIICLGRHAYRAVAKAFGCQPLQLRIATGCGSPSFFPEMCELSPSTILRHGPLIAHGSNRRRIGGAFAPSFDPLRGSAHGRAWHATVP
jgi:hypothetical protein